MPRRGCDVPQILAFWAEGGRPGVTKGKSKLPTPLRLVNNYPIHDPLSALPTTACSRLLYAWTGL